MTYQPLQSEDGTLKTAAASRRSLYLAPGVVTKGEDAYALDDGPGLLCSREFWLIGIACVALWALLAWWVMR